ncbi:unnamed protein product [Dovyalis caffra]|uniref:Coiled-coil domain-containing protein R3HCC1L n=1 Tax=Dovyalis caffra TaxID=77055 RepID=A0AAV1REM3_9ROSI|nr:unnamed protein product [Dovyalis caffra]
MERARAQEEAQSDQNWSEAVEDLVTAGDTEGAIALLETEISRLETLSPSETVNLQLASELTELAKLYSSKHFSLKSDQILSRASLIKQRFSGDAENVKKDDEISKCNAISNDGRLEKSSNPRDNISPCSGPSDDDWEAVADRAPDELLPPQSLPSVSNISLEDTKVQTAKRRGRGPFTYKKHEMYSDRQSVGTLVDDVDDEDLCKSTQNTESTNSKYGTHHALVLAGFPPSTRTTDLEKLFEDFKDRGFAIRWINDTAALTVFQTPSIVRSSSLKSIGEGLTCCAGVLGLNPFTDTVIQLAAKGEDIKEGLVACCQSALSPQGQGQNSVLDSGQSSVILPIEVLTLTTKISQPCDLECKSGLGVGRAWLLPSISTVLFNNLPKLAHLGSRVRHSGCNLVVPFGASRWLMSSSNFLISAHLILKLLMLDIGRDDCFCLLSCGEGWLSTLEACNYVQCPFAVRILDEDDELMGSIPTKDLEPPRRRPKTSARTAERLIAHGMGLTLPTTFGSRELKTQEETRKNRIVTRQKMKDDAWGDD